MLAQYGSTQQAAQARRSSARLSPAAVQHSADRTHTLTLSASLTATVCQQLSSLTSSTH